MRFKVGNKFAVEVTVRFEPSGAELALDPGDWITVEWPDGDDRFIGFVKGEFFGAFVYDRDALIISEPGGGLARLWNSSGEELSILDGWPI